MLPTGNNPQFFDLTKENEPSEQRALADSLDSLRHAIEDNTIAMIGMGMRLGGAPCR